MIKNLVTRLNEEVVSSKVTSVIWGIRERVKVEKRVVYCMFSLVVFLYYTVDVE